VALRQRLAGCRPVGDTPTTMNHFLALRLDDDTTARLSAVIDRLRAWELPARWTHPADLHVTLCFLGPLDADAAAQIPAAISLVAGHLRAPRLRLAGLGAAGGRQAPRAVFAACADPEGDAEGLHRDLAEALDQALERDFRPHVTLCRPSPPPPGLPLFRDWPHLIEAHGIADWGPCGATHLALWRRRDPPGAVRYEIVDRWTL
jgi:2'-5' RNA ligase